MERKSARPEAMSRRAFRAGMTAAVDVIARRVGAGTRVPPEAVSVARGICGEEFPSSDANRSFVVHRTWDACAGNLSRPIAAVHLAGRTYQRTYLRGGSTHACC